MQIDLLADLYAWEDRRSPSHSPRLPDACLLQWLDCFTYTKRHHLSVNPTHPSPSLERKKRTHSLLLFFLCPPLLQASSQNCILCLPPPRRTVAASPTPGTDVPGRSCLPRPRPSTCPATVHHTSSLTVAVRRPPTYAATPTHRAARRHSRSPPPWLRFSLSPAGVRLPLPVAAVLPHRYSAVPTPSSLARVTTVGAPCECGNGSGGTTSLTYWTRFRFAAATGMATIGQHSSTLLPLWWISSSFFLSRLMSQPLWPQLHASQLILRVFMAIYEQMAFNLQAILLNHVNRFSRLCVPVSSEAISHIICIFMGALIDTTTFVVQTDPINSACYEKEEVLVGQMEMPTCPNIGSGAYFWDESSVLLVLDTESTTGSSWTLQSVVISQRHLFSWDGSGLCGFYLPNEQSSNWTYVTAILPMEL